MRARLLLLFIALSALGFNDTAQRYYFDSCPTCGVSSATVRQNSILLSEWNGEAELGLNYNGRGKLQASKYSHKLLETDITLTGRPSGDDLAFDLHDGNDLWFFPQSDSPHTPPNVVGSIAVYHKYKRDHVIGKMNYESGKLWHFYRPEAVDAESKRAFGTVTVNNGKLVEHFPDSYIASAAYPMFITIQVGYVHVGASCTDYGLAGDLYGEIYTVTGGSGTLSDFQWASYSNNDCVTATGTIGATFAVTPTNGGGTDPSGQTNIASTAGGTMNCDKTFHPQSFSGGSITNTHVYLAFQEATGGCFQPYDTSFVGPDGGGGTNTGNYALKNITYVSGNLNGGTMPASMSTGSGVWYTGYFEYSNGSSPTGNPSTCFLLKVCP